jgi:membrane protease YdiL (CAAX protease family)
MTENGTHTKPGMLRAFPRLAPVRLVLFFVVLLAAYAGGQIALLQLAKVAPPGEAQLVAIAATLAVCAALLGIYALLVRWIERRKAEELATSPGLRLALSGAAFGFVLFCVVYAVLWAMGVARWEGVARTGSLVGPVLGAAVAAVGEELAIRGGVFRILEESLGTGLALTLSAALFGLLHASNRGATTISTLAIALEAGVLLGAAYAASRNLWLPIGLHFGWNFTEGGVFGAVVSGGSTGARIVKMPLSGPELLTGGAFGPEASVMAVAVCLVAALILLAVAVRRGRWRPLSFRMLLT